MRTRHTWYLVADCLFLSVNQASRLDGLDASGLRALHSLSLDAPALFNWGSACDCVCLVKCGRVCLQFEIRFLKLQSRYSMRQKSRRASLLPNATTPRARARRIASTHGFHAVHIVATPGAPGPKAGST